MARATAPRMLHSATGVMDAVARCNSYFSLALEFNAARRSPLARHDTDRGSFQARRQPPWPHLPGWTARQERVEVLHELGLLEVSSTATNWRARGTASTQSLFSKQEA